MKYLKIIFLMLLSCNQILSFYQNPFIKINEWNNKLNNSKQLYEQKIHYDSNMKPKNTYINNKTLKQHSKEQTFLDDLIDIFDFILIHFVKKR